MFSPRGINMRLFVAILCASVFLDFGESLLDQKPVSNGQTDQLLQELQRNFSIFQHVQHEMELQLSLLKQKYTMESIVQNKTITAQRQKILELKQQQGSSMAMIMEQNKTIANQEQEIANHDKMIADQGKKISDQNKKLYESMSMIMERNKTITDMEQKIADQVKKLTGQDQKIVMLEHAFNYNITNIDRRNILLEQTDRQQQQKILEMEGRVNQSFGSYEVILYDFVKKQNQHAAIYTNQIQTLNQSAAGLSKQFHYLALSVQDAVKRTNLLNASFSRKCIQFFVHMLILQLRSSLKHIRSNKYISG